MLPNAQPKPTKGSTVLERRAKRKAIEADEDAKKRAAKARDGHRCRWPRSDHDTPGHVCVGPIESAHQVALGMGGDKTGDRTSTAGLLSCCRWIHQLGYFSLEQHGRKWEGETPAGADGPIAFFRQGPDGTYVMVGRETSIGVLERD